MKKWHMMIDVAAATTATTAFWPTRTSSWVTTCPPIRRPSPGRPPLDEHRAQGAGPVPTGAGGLSAPALHALRRCPLPDGPTGPSTSGKTVWSSSTR